jgi:uncharacterized membrane protein
VDSSLLPLRRFGNAVSTTLLAQFLVYRVALLLYWANIALSGVTLYFSWVCAANSGLLKPDLTSEVSRAIERRIVVAQALYAFGAALCVINTYWSIGFIVLVQLNYAIAPRLPWRSQNLPRRDR